MTTIRRLGPSDEPLLRALALEDADFDIEGRGGDRAPVSPEDGRGFLSDPAVMFWVAEEPARGGASREIVGFLHCQLVRKRAGEASELLLYEIGVRARARRRGVGGTLLEAMRAYMGAHGIAEVWVLADNPGATAFYTASGFEAAEAQPVYLTRRLS